MERRADYCSAFVFVPDVPTALERLRQFGTDTVMEFDGALSIPEVSTLVTW